MHFGKSILCKTFTIQNMYKKVIKGEKTAFYEFHLESHSPENYVIL